MAEFQTNLGDDREHTIWDDAPAWPASPAEQILSGLGLPVEFAGQLGGVSEARLPLVRTGVLLQVLSPIPACRSGVDAPPSLRIRAVKRPDIVTKPCAGGCPKPAEIGCSRPL